MDADRKVGVEFNAKREFKMAFCCHSFFVFGFSSVKADATSNFSDNNWQVSWLIKNADKDMSA